MDITLGMEELSVHEPGIILGGFGIGQNILRKVYGDMPNIFEFPISCSVGSIERF